MEPFFNDGATTYRMSQFVNDVQEHSSNIPHVSKRKLGQLTDSSGKFNLTQKAEKFNGILPIHRTFSKVTSKTFPPTFFRL